MEITLFSPIDNEKVNIAPKHQDEILASLPNNSGVIEDTFAWQNPVVGKGDFSKPQSIVFSWNMQGDFSNVTDIYLLLSNNIDFDNPEEYRIEPGQMFLSLTNFIRNTEYYWKMAAYSDAFMLCESEVGSFRTDNKLPQWFDIDGISNVRDIGGWKAKDGKTVKEGMIYRGSEMDNLLKITPYGVSLMREMLHIKTDLDVRSDDEIPDITNLPIPDSEYIQVPLKPYAHFEEEEQKKLYADLFNILSNNENYPIYLHCVAGADRTGTAVYLLKALLGVSDEDNITDYELTSLCVFGARCRSQASFTEFVNKLSEYGSESEEQAYNYLISAGVTDETIQKIKSLLLI